tara:strand:+ start:276 stop:605 length:330 start_codon:yes stop_codon:yes gene_type:complete
MQQQEEKKKDPMRPDGMIFFPSRPTQPEWAKGKVVVNKYFVDWLQEALKDPTRHSLYKGEPQVRLDVNISNLNGTPDKPEGYMKVDTFGCEPAGTTAKSTSSDDDDLFG